MVLNFLPSNYSTSVFTVSIMSDQASYIKFPANTQCNYLLTYSMVQDII
jgi:hypothetical protein